MKRTVLLWGILTGFAALAAGKGTPVCAGYPDWQGLEKANYITGRKVTPSDLRHKVTIVFEFEYTTELQQQLMQVLPFASAALQSHSTGIGQDEPMVPRDVMFIAVNRGDKAPAEIKAALNLGKDAAADVVEAMKVFSNPAIPFYDGVTFTGGPDNGGKLPYLYVMGLEKTEPLFAGRLTADGIKEATAAMRKGLKQIENWPVKWKPYFGHTPKPTHFVSLVKKQLEAGKPMKPLLATLLASVQDKDEDKAREAQVTYDAIVQAKSDLVLKITQEAATAPHLALLDLNLLLQQFPEAKKDVQAVVAKAKSIPDIGKLVKMYSKAKVWADPEFKLAKPADAKKIAAEIGKMKKDLGKLKNSKVPAIAAAAGELESLLDSAAQDIAAKAAK